MMLFVDFPDSCYFSDVLHHLPLEEATTSHDMPMKDFIFQATFYIKSSNDSFSLLFHLFSFTLVFLIFQLIQYFSIYTNHLQ